MTKAESARSGDPATEDVFLGGKLVLQQPARGYRAGTDAVLLAAAVDASTGARVLDVGAGAGAVGLCLATRLPSVHVTLVEREPQLVALARTNVEVNGLPDRVVVVQADVGRLPRDLSDGALRDESFDVVVSNPPFHDWDAGTTAGDDLKASSHALRCVTLLDWVRFMTRMAAPGGRFLMIHKADALARLLAVIDGRFGGLSITPVQPRRDVPAGRVLIAGIKGSRAPLRLMPPIVLHGPGHGFLPEIDAVLRDGKPLLLRA